MAQHLEHAEPPFKAYEAFVASAAVFPEERAGLINTASRRPKATGNVHELMQADAQDESLRKYKEQLLGAAAKGDLGDVSFWFSFCLGVRLYCLFYHRRMILERSLSRSLELCLREAHPTWSSISTIRRA